MTSKKKKIIGKQVINKNQRENENQKGVETIDRALAWLFIIAIGILPLLIRVKLVQFISPQIIDEIINTGIRSDIFSYYKWTFLLLLTAVAIGLLVYKITVYGYKTRYSYINAPLLILALFTLLSGVLADYLNISMLGMYNRHEGTLTFLCYLVLFFVAANTSFKEWFDRHIMAALYIVVFINAIIITSDFYGHDFLNIPALKWLIIPASLSSGGLEGHLNSTLSNPNYVSGFAGSITAFFLIAAMLEKNFINKLLHSVFTIISFALLLASLSASGFVTLVLIIPVILALVLINPGRLQSLATGVAILLSCVAVFYIMASHNPQVWKETVGSLGVFKIDIETETRLNPTSWIGRLIQPEQAYAGTTDTLTVSSESSEDVFTLPQPSLSTGTGRTYIWKETLKLIGHKPILGYGHDTLAYYFPQNDRNKIANLGTYDVIVSKPHNFYLDLAYSTGIPSLLAFVALISFYFLYSVREKIKTSGSGLEAFPTALFVFLSAFLIQWMFNDSVIGTSVIFWVLFGISAAPANK